MTRLLASCALAAMTLAVGPQPLKATEPLCPLQDATLRGTYLSHGTGTIVGVGPISAVGTATYDGNGNTSNTFTASVNGTIHKDVTVTGTYTVNSDCTGSLAQGGANYNFVVVPDGSRVFWIETDTGVVLSGTQVRFNATDAQGQVEMSSQGKDAPHDPRAASRVPNRLPLSPFTRDAPSVLRKRT